MTRASKSRCAADRYRFSKTDCSSLSLAVNGMTRPIMAIDAACNFEFDDVAHGASREGRWVTEVTALEGAAELRPELGMRSGL